MPRAAFAAQRRRLWGAGHLCGEQLRNRHRRRHGLGQHRPVTDLIQPGVLTGIEQIDRRQPPCRVGGHGDQHLLQPPEQRLDAGRVEHVGVVFDANPKFSPRPGLQRQRVMGGFVDGELGDRQLLVAGQRGGVDWIVFVHEQGVEQLVVSGDAVDLG